MGPEFDKDAIVERFEKHKRIMSTCGAEGVQAESEYSEAINKYIDTIEELRYYQNKIGLIERLILDRPCLIRRKIHLHYVNHRGQSNLELMRNGAAPVSINGKKAPINLHHIRQEFTAPLAELTISEHDYPDEGVILHTEYENSWRNELGKNDIFKQQKAAHWKERCRQIEHTDGCAV